MKLRDFINSLEWLSDNGKYDDIPVFGMTCDGECVDIDWYGIDEVYPLYEIEDGNPTNKTTALVIQI